MEILSFDIEGKFAHFRKYFANNTAFSFGIPPRTTIMGIIAAAIGSEKGSYYTDFNTDRLRIGIFNISPFKKSFHRLNFLSIKGYSDFRGRLKHIQTPFEMVSGINPKTDMVRYRIYLSPTEKGKDVYNKIREVFINKRFHFNPTLGTANFIAQIKNIKIYTQVEQKDIKSEIVKLYSSAISDNVEEIFFDKSNEYRYNLIEEELMPADFKGNFDRETVKMNKLVYIDGGKNLTVKFSGKYYELKNTQSKLNIDFWE